VKQGLLDEARRLESQGRVREAIAAYQTATSIDPDDAVALLGLGSLLRQSGDAAGAKTHLERAANLAERDYRVWCELGLARADLGDFAGARDALQRSVRLNRDFVQGHLLLAQVDLAAGAVEEAIGSARRAVARSARLVDAHALLGMAYAAARRFDEAEAAFGKGLDLAPAHPGLLLNLGNTHRERGALAEAERCYRRALEAERSYLPAAQALAGQLSEAERPDEARKVLEAASQSGGEVPAELLLVAGEALEGLGRVGEAEGAYRAALQRQPAMLEAWGNLFELARGAGDFARAREVADGAARALPRSPEICALHATALFESGDVDGAIDTLESALRRGVESPQIYTSLGSALRLRNRLSESSQALDRALALAPHDGSALAEAALTRHALGDDDAALALGRRATEAAPDSVAGFLALGTLLLGRLAWRDAQEVFARAALLAPAAADPLAGLARALLGLGDFEGARARCSEALALAPGHPEANRVYAELAVSGPALRLGPR
jgi:tetratricopeptide (TPR) repeat protein